MCVSVCVLMLKYSLWRTVTCFPYIVNCYDVLGFGFARESVVMVFTLVSNGNSASEAESCSQVGKAKHCVRYDSDAISIKDNWQ